MKIAVAVLCFDLSGVPLAQLRLAGALASRGFDVDFIVGSINPGVIVKVPKGVCLQILGVAQARRLVMPMTRYLRRAKPDIIFTAQDHLNIAVALAATLVRSRARITASSRITPLDAYSNVPFTKKWVMKHVVRLAWCRIDVLTCVSEGMASEYREMFPGSRHKRVYNIVDDTAIEERDAVEYNDCVLLPILAPEQLLVSAGYLAPWKGFDILLHAIALVPRDLNICLLVLGDGPQRAELEQLTVTLGIESRVKFVGYVANPVPYYRAASLFVHAARTESFGNVLVEAMLCGCTVVATDCPTGPGEILGQGQYGYLVPTEDPAALADGIQRALRRPITPERLCESTSRFRSDVIVNHHLRLLGFQQGGD
jgi:glycosyltransferase involved in cell wall biosynthesis